jgi:hypothetical protein
MDGTENNGKIEIEALRRTSRVQKWGGKIKNTRTELNAKDIRILSVGGTFPRTRCMTPFDA